MTLIIRAFQTSKAGCQIEECEDAFLWDKAKNLFAVADGATDSAFQRLWATLLVESFISGPPDFSSRPAFEAWFKGWIETQQQKWHEGIDWTNLPWHGLNKARQTGALATFLGICFDPFRYEWYALAIGDCNLFIFRQDGTLDTCYPFCNSHEFGTSPAALSSINLNYEVQFKHTLAAGGRYRSGDVILLATDALAAWCLSQHESGDSPLNYLLELRTDAEFFSMIESLRHERQIKDDDTSLLMIQVKKPLALSAKENTQHLETV